MSGAVLYCRSLFAQDIGQDHADLGAGDRVFRPERAVLVAGDCACLVQRRDGRTVLRRVVHVAEAGPSVDLLQNALHLLAVSILVCYKNLCLFNILTVKVKIL